jgi:hypothetical protein
LFKYLPGKDWPVEVKHKIDMMRQKNATDTFIARNKTALQGKTPREKNEASFGSAMVIIAKATRTYAFKYMVPKYDYTSIINSHLICNRIKNIGTAICFTCLTFSSSACIVAV